ncbi:uncharacterized protein P884DRAFT_258879 [Thermothelomyces heterothallicus CBS 202.75]|uniref:uncharacterized protein n=1 Tax=Thermothelomyces heterothallicus CBS 202.75 TaxID=1149848 RepID=UPI003742B9DB
MVGKTALLPLPRIQRLRTVLTIGTQPPYHRHYKPGGSMSRSFTAVVDRARLWLDECLKTHAGCSPSADSLLPTRVLEEMVWMGISTETALDHRGFHVVIGEYIRLGMQKKVRII